MLERALIDHGSPTLANYEGRQPVHLVLRGCDGFSRGVPACAGSA